MLIFNQTVKIFDNEANKVECTLQNIHTEYIRTLAAFRSKGEILTGSYDKTVKHIDIGARGIVRSY